MRFTSCNHVFGLFIAKGKNCIFCSAQSMHSFTHTHTHTTAHTHSLTLTRTWTNKHAPTRKHTWSVPTFVKISCVKTLINVRLILVKVFRWHPITNVSTQSVIKISALPCVSILPMPYLVVDIDCDTPDVNLTRISF